MFSLTNSIRAAVRQCQAPSRWRSPVITIASRLNSTSVAGESLGELSELLAKEGNAPSVRDQELLDPVIRGNPNLKGFRSGRFVKPASFTYNQRVRKQRMAKRPLLGPDARESRELDVFYQLELDPLDECMNTSLLSEFVTEMGKIKRRSETKLTWRNQRRVGKAIRRAKMMGLIPILSRRPLSTINEGHYYRRAANFKRTGYLA
ncbi:uncharacterized protein LAESUDRAFT_668323 [Laetiporus sulphureus 93-53]|uniref:Small ribosomal subunit protein bS18m n=1 Tax=Laetiporus sulphureus 93-53 TaxID=1314785 RepID=A0A165I3T8_9APHY|nr:uncharacterized protein LAESUDRAFT_668323 [Laetiporus sulphureus 93-53]KZT12559.1 hypothetical protein LAESUDRAFT_668323 [Laetiporus sulphureus 93-53]